MNYIPGFQPWDCDLFYTQGSASAKALATRGSPVLLNFAPLELLFLVVYRIQIRR
jgi:hypothetical protein